MDRIKSRGLNCNGVFTPEACVRSVRSTMHRTGLRPLTPVWAESNLRHAANEGAPDHEVRLWGHARRAAVLPGHRRRPHQVAITCNLPPDHRPAAFTP